MPANEYPEGLCPAPDYAEPIMGVRAWLVNGERSWQVVANELMPVLQRPFALASMYRACGIWGREMEAECPTPEPYRSNHAFEHCSCGLYAYYDYALASAPSAAQRGACYVLGVVSASGDVVLYEKGFRAQRMRIEALIIASPYADPPVTRELAESYEVAVLLPEQVEGFCAERGIVMERQYLGRSETYGEHW